ncbi:hypothetical protein NIES4075_00130 [Tolypothrix sp. NIES-4075]|uniref:hypothetical protein n=1 Tax=Tolypothrix sp. NIES-4075 TaxID=2005459 RepID=UPI000B5C3560|nr:hypothetical protein [Tolypothrix sp. NIES-4075]GAX39062.1 hypothetical protein NIES4075_00130 [Tolypothrix sp. NIES-4075]
MNNNQPITAQSSTTPRADLLLEIEQTPEEYLPELLQTEAQRTQRMKRAIALWRFSDRSF